MYFSSSGESSVIEEHRAFENQCLIQAKKIYKIKKKKYFDWFFLSANICSFCTAAYGQICRWRMVTFHFSLAGTEETVGDSFIICFFCCWLPTKLTIFIETSAQEFQSLSVLGASMENNSSHQIVIWCPEDFKFFFVLSKMAQGSFSKWSLWYAF